MSPVVSLSLALTFLSGLRLPRGRHLAAVPFSLFFAISGKRDKKKTLTNMCYAILTHSRAFTINCSLHSGYLSLVVS
jgi:hypothetical protein